MKLLRNLVLLSAIVLVLPFTAFAQKQSIPRPEYPLPQMKRAEWLNLNGTWEFAETDDNADDRYLSSESYPDKIVVPFPRESKLSGLERKGFIKNVWYRRTFVRPIDWKSARTRLHIGACDYFTRVWINGQLVGQHKGASAPLVVDITDALIKGENTIVVNAYDDTRSQIQTLGKQCEQLESIGCTYTRTTGIWQTVWLEGVGSTYIKELNIQPNPDNSLVSIQSDVIGDCDGLTFKAVAYAGNKIVGTAQAPADWRNSRLAIKLSEKHLWSPTSPFLYDLKLTLLRNGKVIDQLDSYFGMRSISIRGAAILINNKPIFQRLVAEQAFFPDGIWTAPTDEAMKHDIEIGKAAGFNGARLHQKVFDPRYLYWADKMGYLCWGEFPNWGVNMDKLEGALPIVNEWTEVLRRDRNHPSIIGWCPFNESLGQYSPELQSTVVNITHTIDPTRPVLESSGWIHSVPDPEVLDAHDYDQNPESFRTHWSQALACDTDLPERYMQGIQPPLLPFFVSEFGGTGWGDANGGWGYGDNPKSEEDFYVRFKGLIDSLLDNRMMFGFTYTQLLDTEQEHNGLYTNERKPKFDVERLRKIVSRTAEYEKDPPFTQRINRSKDWKVLVGAVQDGKQAKEWRYTTVRPQDAWNKPGFDDSSWQTGLGGFGRKDGWDWATKTTWTTDDIWLRQEFNYDGAVIDAAKLVLQYDDGVEIYVNGLELWKSASWSDSYVGVDVTKALKTAIKPGKNVIAVHCHNICSGQFIDAALMVSK